MSTFNTRLTVLVSPWERVTVAVEEPLSEYVIFGGSPLTDRVTVGVCWFTEVRDTARVAVLPCSTGGRKVGETVSMYLPLVEMTAKSLIAVRGGEEPVEVNSTGYLPPSKISASVGTLITAENSPLDMETGEVKVLTTGPNLYPVIVFPDSVGKPEPWTVTVAPLAP